MTRLTHPARKNSILSNSCIWALRCALFSLLATATHLSALEFECSITGDVRFIQFELPGKEHLCEISVTDQNSERRVMWYADHDTSFCSEKALNLRDKYTSKWGFDCVEWSDRTGVDELSPRHRSILDRELTLLIKRGEHTDTGYQVLAVKVAAAGKSPANKETTLAIQFFLANNDGTLQDQTHVIKDNGTQWQTYAKIDSLATHIDASAGFNVSNAIVTKISVGGALEIETVIDAASSESLQGNCYGNQVLIPEANGKLRARTPHRFVCTDQVTTANISEAG